MITEFIGRFHPVFVHLPIGIFVIVVAMEFMGRTKRFSHLLFSINFMLPIGVITGVFSLVTGYLLSLNDSNESTAVSQHKWVAIFTVVMYLGYYFLRQFIIDKKGIQTTILILLLVMITTTGHLGGTITHGEGYLFSSTNDTPKEKEIIIEKALPELEKKQATTDSSAQPTEIFLYRDQISPILQSKCYACHSKIKMKGGLRLDSKEFILKGGKNGAVLTKGNPEKSTLYEHLILPMEDDLHMPPKGKRQPTIQEIQLIHNWIKRGSPFGGIMPTDKEIKTIISPLPVLIPQEMNVDVPNFSTQKEKNSTKPITAADPESIEAIKKTGLIALPIQEESNGLSINFVNIKQYDHNFNRM